MGEFSYDGIVTPWQATMGDNIAGEAELAKVFMPWAFPAVHSALNECFWMDCGKPELIARYKDLIAYLCMQYLQNNEVKSNQLDCVVKSFSFRYYGKSQSTRYTATTAGGKSLVWFKCGKPEELAFEPYQLTGRIQKRQEWKGKTSYVLKEVNLYSEETW